MAKTAFTKQALSTPDLIAFLIQKGLIVNDYTLAFSKINSIGYYRLKIYTRPLQQAGKVFIAGTRFEQVIALYEFDRNLRLVTLDAIERIEVALRATIINIMCAAGGPHFYYNESFFDDKSHGGQTKSSVTDIRFTAAKSKHTSISHYARTYHTPHLAPIWCIMEGSTFGNVSRLFADLKIAHRKSIAAPFGIDEAVLVSWFKSINTLRNICAHHNRLWNALLVVDMPKVAKSIRAQGADNKTYYSRVLIMREVLNGIDKPYSDDWANKLKSFLIANPHISLSDMGFPPNWNTLTFWN